MKTSMKRMHLIVMLMFLNFVRFLIVFLVGFVFRNRFCMDEGYEAQNEKGECDFHYEMFKSTKLRFTNLNLMIYLNDVSWQRSNIFLYQGFVFSKRILLTLISYHHIAKNRYRNKISNFFINCRGKRKKYDDYSGFHHNNSS
jgi:hypothetical protein